MPQELPYQRLLEDFGSAFNVEGLMEIQITWEVKGVILEGAVDRARWWLGLGNRSQEPQNYQQAIMAVREVIAVNTNDSRFISLSTSSLHVSRSFFDKVCSLVEESERRKTVEKIGSQKKTSGQRRLLPAPTPRTQQPSSTTANSSQSTPCFIQETSTRHGERHFPPDAPNSAPSNSSGTTSSRKRKISEGSAAAGRGGEDKGKGRAMPGSYGEAKAGFTTFPEPLTVNPTEQNLLRGISSSVGIGGAGPSSWDSSLKGPGKIHYPIQLNLKGLTGSESAAPASNQQTSSQKTANSISKIHTQFLLRIRKANLAALTPSQRVQLNLCISQANHLEGVPSIPLIGNAPKLHHNTGSSTYSSAANLVRDCQNALSLASSPLPSSVAAIPVPSGTIESPPPKRVKAHKNLSEHSEECRQGRQKRLSQEIPSLRKPKNSPSTKIRASTNTKGTYIHATHLEAEDRMVTAVVGDAISSSESMPANASLQALSPSVPRFPSMAPHGSGNRWRSPSRSIQQPAAIQQTACHWSDDILIPVSTASGLPVPTVRHPSDYIGASAQALQGPSVLSLLSPYHEPQHLFPCDSTNPIYINIHPNPTPATTPSSLIGNQDNEISGNDNLLNSYNEQAFFSQDLNTPIEEYIGGQDLYAPQLFFESGYQMGSGMEQLQSTTSPIYGQQMVDFSQWHFQEMPQQAGIHMSYMSMTGHQLIPPSQFQQQMQWAQDNSQACPPGSKGGSD